MPNTNFQEHQHPRRTNGQFATKPPLPRGEREEIPGATTGQSIAKMSLRDRLAMARDTATSPDVLRQLAVNRSKTVREEVACNSSTPPDVIAQFATCQDLGMRRSALQNPSIPLFLLRQMATDENPYIRADVASNLATPADVFDLLSRDPVWFVRALVASNTMTPAPILRQMAKDDSRVMGMNRAVQISVAENTAAPPDLLEEMVENNNDPLIIVPREIELEDQGFVMTICYPAESDDWMIRESVANNPAALTATLHRLEKDDVQKVRKAAKKQLKARRARLQLIHALPDPVS